MSKHSGTNYQMNGLTTEEINERIAASQTNKQPRTVGKSVPRILADNLFTLFNLLNAVLAIALIAVGSYRNLLFMGVVVSNTLIGTVQELRAKRTIERLTLLSAPTVCAIRNGTMISLSLDEVVLDDLIEIAAGDQLCADAEVIDGQGAMDESLLTGESEPIDKAPGDVLLSGSYVTEGKMRARVTRVGSDSYASQLTIKARSIKPPHSELMQSMRYIIRTVGAVLVPLGVILFYKQLNVLDGSLQQAVTSTVGAVLGMIPEGLMLLTSVALAVGVVRLGQRKTLVQDMYGIEALARVDILCLDKTGTITEGSMVVVDVDPLMDVDLSQLEQSLGALISVLDDNNATFAALRSRFTCPNAWQTVCTVPFSSARKWSGASFDSVGSYVIGAAEFVLGGQMDAGLSDRIGMHAQRGLRVLILCHSPLCIEDKKLPKDLVPVALVLLSDVLRADAKETIDFFREQGVQLKVISGDNPVTVAAVAHQAGFADAANFVDASTLQTVEAVEQAASNCSIFGRVTPDQKKEIVDALKRQGHTVGMIGDGVNDIPALKASDCAIAMAGGSDAARRVSQLTLLDANFSVVPEIVMEGRRVINNITRAASLFLVKTTFSFILSFLLVFIHAHYPFAPIQMTLISTTMIGIPSFILALEPNRARVTGNFLFNVLRNALPGGLTIVLQILTIFAFSSILKIDQATQSTIATWTTGFTGLVVLFITCRPLNWRRAALVILMATAFIGAALLFGQVFYLIPLSTTHALFAGTLVIASVPSIIVLRKLINWIMRSIAK